MPIRLKDIARDLNLSVITISKALRGNSDISDATRQRILARMKELDYRPNLTARSLATGQSFIAGLIVPDLLNPFYTELALSLSVELRRQSYSLILASSDGQPEIERSEIRMMLARGVDTLLIASCQRDPAGLLVLEAQNKEAQDTEAPNTPFVLIDRAIPGLDANFVGIDDAAGGRLATEHLLQLGRKRLAYLGGPEPNHAAPDRLRGFRAALQAHGIPLAEEFLLTDPPDAADPAADLAGYRMMRTLLQLPTRPDGVFCHNDVIAIGAMKAAQEAGLSIPADIAFVGFDNVRYSKYLQIPLTSVDQLTPQLGIAAAQLALSLVAERKDPPAPRSILLAPTLVVRQSSLDERTRTEPS
jgi:LacI family transcriptional regulator